MGRRVRFGGRSRRSVGLGGWLLAPRKVGFLGGFGWIAGGADVWVQSDGGGHEVCEGRVEAGAEIYEIPEVVNEAEGDAVSDEVAFRYFSAHCWAW